MQLDRLESERAFRIAIRINEHHTTLSSLYEKLVDREFILAAEDIRLITSDLKLITKSIEEDDF
jgi:hypothetical protein